VLQRRSTIERYLPVRDAVPTIIASVNGMNQKKKELQKTKACLVARSATP
jgi:hypothetical protein